MNSDNEMWEERWRDGRTGWDLGAPHPYLGDLWKLSLAQPPARVWVPGCGRGHDAAALAKLGYDVLATDLSAIAIKEAQRCYPGIGPSLRFEVSDLFETRASQFDGPFDYVYDRAMMCALPPGKQEAYLRVCASELKPGGKFCSILFSMISGKPTEGPPFEIDGLRSAELFSKGWKVLETKAVVPAPTPKSIREETLWIAERL